MFSWKMDQYLKHDRFFVRDRIMMDENKKRYEIVGGVYERENKKNEDK